MGKKKIDELFQEKFNNFEQMPDEKVWQAIEASLNKKKRRGIPLWWKLGGVAAVLAIGLLAINPFASTTDAKPAITNSAGKYSDSLNQEEKRQNQILNKKQVNETQLTDTNEPKNIMDVSNENTSNNEKSSKGNLKLLPNTSNEKNNQLTALPQEKSRNTNTADHLNNERTEVANNTPKNEATPAKILNQTKQPTAEALAQNKTTKTEIAEKSNEQTLVENKNNDGAKSNDKELSSNTKDTGVAEHKTELPMNEKTGDTLPRKKSIYDEIIAQEEEAIAENASKNKWSAGPSIAPVYFDAFGEGSPVHSILVPNSKSGNTNLSYGLSVAYEINDRLSVRSGIHKVDYGYETGEIEFSSALDGSITNQMDNIDYAVTARNLVVKSRAGNTAVAVNENNNASLDANTNSMPRNGSMSQQFGYLEVPLELNYALIDQKIGVNLIGGFSSLFLIDNSVLLSDGNQTTEMGEANNINNLNFSTNIGLGIDYNFSSNIKLNIEPVFKYQLNTFNQVDGTFNPFSIGVYSGLTFRF